MWFLRKLTLGAIVEPAGLVFCNCLSKRKKMRSRPVVIYNQDLRQRWIDGIY